MASARIGQLVRMAILVAALLPFTVSLQAFGPTQCFPPGTVATLLEDSRVRNGVGRPEGPFLDLKADSLAFDTPGGEQLWIGLGWDGPPWGGLVVLNCDRRLLGTRSDGYTDSIRIGPELVGVGKTVVLYAQTGSGSGFRRDEFILLGFQRDSILPLWKGTTLEDDYEMPTQGGEETRRKITVSTNDGTIEVSGAYRKVKEGARPGEWVTVESRQLKPQRYCWDSGHLRYEQCPY